MTSMSAVDPGNMKPTHLQEVLPVIDETRPNVATPESVMKKAEEDEEMMIKLGGSHKGVKGKIRGLKDKYVSCLQAVDGGKDLRGCAASGGGPALAIHVTPIPFDNATTMAT